MLHMVPKTAGWSSETCSGQNRGDGVSTWPTPATGWVAASVDGSFLQAGTAGNGAVLRDHTGAV